LTIPGDGNYKQYASFKRFPKGKQHRLSPLMPLVSNVMGNFRIIEFISLSILGTIYFTEINHVLLASRGYEYDGILDFLNFIVFNSLQLPLVVLVEPRLRIRFRRIRSLCHIIMSSVEDSYQSFVPTHYECNKFI
jgi:hypothetical protein